MARLIYVDEQESERNNFAREMHQDFDVVLITPESDIDECVDTILSSGGDVIVTDFRLNEHQAIGYLGTDLIDKILSRKEGFPVFVFTGFPNGDGDVAIDHVEDANMVYDKSDLTDEKKKRLFKDKVSTNAERYKRRIQAAEDRLAELVKKENLSPKEESELVSIDSFLERALDKESSIPNSIKEQFLENKFDLVISKIDRVLGRVK